MTTSIASRVSHFKKLMGTSTPIVQAPMAGVTTPRLVAAASNAGALGSHAVPFRTPSQVISDFKAIRTLTPHPISCNVFAMPQMSLSEVDGSLAEFEATTRALVDEYKRLGIAMPDASKIKLNESYDEQLEALLDSGVKVQSVSFTFGLLSSDWVGRLHAANILVIGTATCVQEALLIEESGADAVVIQGIEAGGHQASFLERYSNQQTAFPGGGAGLFSLIPETANKVSIPIIAAGGIMDGRGVAAALTLGASAVQMGTAFMTCIESEAKDQHKAAVLECADGVSGTVATTIYSGKQARGIRNKFYNETVKNGVPIARYPIQQAATNPIKAASFAQGDLEMGSMWCGQTPTLARNVAVDTLVKDVMAETRSLVTLDK